ncbi:MAG TPA: rhomboid family intramembrane serine protease [Gemmatimonadales bacterium]|nr:rhomboid family intramembrane serine protease [Gemmatimonadales bacterium]
MTVRRHAITPWVGRLALANAAILVVFRAVITGPGAPAALRFDPEAFPGGLTRALTYPFIHDSAFHLLLALVPLLLFGPPVERRFGGRGFLALYLYAATVAALVGVALAELTTVPAMSGALAPATGLLFAWAWLGRDDEVRLDPLAVRVRLGALGAFLLLTLTVTAAIVADHGLSLAHLGGALGAWIFFRLRALIRPDPPALPLPVRRASLAPMRVQVRESPPQEAPASPPVPQPSMGVEDAAEALNRVLDKISAQGIDSLTPQERRLLTNYAESKRRTRDT